MSTTKNSNVGRASISARWPSVMEDAWPDGLSPIDEALFAQATPEVRTLIERRLKSILAAETGDRPMADLAQEAGLDRTRFFRLRQRWRADRSLRSVIPQGQRRPRKIAPRAKSAAASSAKGVVESAVALNSPSLSTSYIAGLVVGSLQGGVSMQTATRLVRLERARQARDPEVLKTRFGEEMLIDLCAVSLRLSEGADVGGAVVVAVVMDAASRLLIGHAAGGVHNSLGLQRRAMERAIALLDVDESRGLPAQTHLVLGWSDKKRLTGLEFFAWSRPGVRSVSATSPHRFGRSLIDLIGHRIDRLRLKPKSTDPDSTGHRNVRDLSGPPMTEAHARAFVDEAVENYNAPIIATLKEAGVLRPAGAGAARMAVTLDYLLPGFT